MDLNSISGLKESSAESHAAVLCPMLESIQIEIIDQPKLITCLKDVVTLHGAGVSPLKRFTSSQFYTKPKGMFKLIGKDGEFSKEVVHLALGVELFELDIQLEWSWSHH